MIVQSADPIRQPAPRAPGFGAASAEPFAADAGYGLRLFETGISGVMIVEPVRHEDPRGWFCETYNRRALAQHGIIIDFIQDNQSASKRAGTIRGLHFQAPPHAQAKLVRVVRGGIFDVAVDIRRNSPTYGRYVSALLNSDNGRQMLIGSGFAHGYCTLEPDTVVAYKTDAHYEPELDRGLVWNDPALDIAWPMTTDDVTISDKDRCLPILACLGSPFIYRRS